MKAEILRKHGEVNKAKLDNRVKIANAEKKQTPLDLKNKGIDERRRNDIVEDEDLLRKSRWVEVNFFKNWNVLNLIREPI